MGEWIGTWIVAVLGDEWVADERYSWQLHDYLCCVFVICFLGGLWWLVGKAQDENIRNGLPPGTMVYWETKEVKDDTHRA